MTKKKLTKREETARNSAMCLACPASLLCVQYAIRVIYNCTNCGITVVHFLSPSKGGDKIRMTVPECFKLGLNVICYNCASEYKE